MRIEQIEFHVHAKGTLVGFASLALGNSGLRVHDCPVHCKNDKWWINLPAKPYTGKDGVQRWQPILEFGDNDSRRRFQEAALAALRFRFPDTFPANLVEARDDGHGREHL
jgi:hypothetical protein